MRYLIVASLLLFAAFVHAQQVVSYPGKVFIYTLYIDTFQCKSNDQSTVDSIVVETKTDKRRVQGIRPNNADGNGIPCGGDLLKNGQFQIVDANFDGHEDILLMQFLPAAPNIPYYYWIYNTASKKFVEDTALENITSPQFDSVKHQITSYWRDDCCDHGTDTYSYMNNKAILIQQVEDIADPNGTAPDTLIERKVIAGKLTEVSRKVQK
jgi:hypothetical protein